MSPSDDDTNVVMSWGRVIKYRNFTRYARKFEEKHRREIYDTAFKLARAFQFCVDKKLENNTYQ
jgi:hypothetical protein